MYLSEVSRQIGDRRRALGLSLAQLARRANTSPATLSRYENGWARFELYTVRKLATALGCDLVVRLEPKTMSTAPASHADAVRRLRRLFWDRALTVRHLEENTLWVVERVLEYGALDDVHTLVRLLGREAFLGLVAQARFSSERTRGLWRQVLAREGWKCTRRFSRDEAATSWRGSGR
jgi:transcriptional regulator with XRE-family HTH domain